MLFIQLKSSLLCLVCWQIFLVISEYWILLNISSVSLNMIILFSLHYVNDSTNFPFIFKTSFVYDALYFMHIAEFSQPIFCWGVLYLTSWDIFVCIFFPFPFLSFFFLVQPLFLSSSPLFLSRRCRSHKMSWEVSTPIEIPYYHLTGFRIYRDSFYSIPYIGNMCLFSFSLCQLC